MTARVANMARRGQADGPATALAADPPTAAEPVLRALPGGPEPSAVPR
ncbi:hypothetical protein ABT072_47590 [Streptomyces sp. NPDC002589]